MTSSEIIMKYLPYAITPDDRSLSSSQHLDMCQSVNDLFHRRSTPFKLMAKEICSSSKSDPTSRSILTSFIKHYSSDCYNSLEAENIECFKQFYIDGLSPEDIAERNGYCDRRTTFKKIDRINTIFAMFLYDMCLFINS